jgi:hypothetical protein
MNTSADESRATADPAAVLGAAVSLWQACQQPQGNEGQVDLSASYGDGIEWMREVMRGATLFETWAMRHVCFDEFDDCWPYFLEDRFGDACVELIGADGLARFDERDCLRVAVRLRLPVKCLGPVAVPLLLTADNPVPGAGFGRFRIQTMRHLAGEDGMIPMTIADDPSDDEFSSPFFALYGAEADGRLEHIADRRTYAEARALVMKLVPGIVFPEVAVAHYPGA